MRVIKRFIFLGVLVLIVVGCNTMEGIGKDISAVGEKLEESAGKNKK